MRWPTTRLPLRESTTACAPLATRAISWRGDSWCAEATACELRCYGNGASARPCAGLSGKSWWSVAGSVEPLVPMLRSILLIGPRAAGKSTIGRLLASQLGGSFVDLDEEVRARFGGATVAEIWRVHGEAAFRAAEGAALAELLDGPRRAERRESTQESAVRVVSLGGGTPMVEQARGAIADARARDEARVALLLAPIETLAGRLSASGDDRPSLTGDAPACEVQRVLAARMPTYCALADASFDTSLGEPSQIAATIATWVGSAA